MPCKWKWEKKVKVTIFISDKIDFKTNTLRRDKESHSIMIKQTIQQEAITVVNLSAPNIGAPKYIKTILTDIKEEIDRNTIIGGDFNTPLMSVDRSSRQKSTRKQWL